MKNISRRDALKFGAIAGGALLLPIGLQRKSYAGDAGSPKVTPFSQRFQVPPVLSPVRSDATTDYYQINVNKTRVSLLPGLSSEVFSYNGLTPGPTIIQRKDRQSVVRFINNSIGTPTSTHLHGMASLPQYDGYAEDLIYPGQYKDYIYPNNRAATLWYHDHAIHKTAINVYKGLAGLYLVKDDFEAGLNLPSGAYDVPLLLKDMIFRADGTVVYDDQGEKGVMGDVITVNGVAWPRMEVANRKYRFRLLNCSVSRSYELALSNGGKLTMIGTDAGLTGAPVDVANFRVGPAERYEFVIDFSKYPVGTKIVLRNLQPPNNDNYDGTEVVMRFDVVRKEADNSSVPAKLRDYPVLAESSAVRTREFRYERTNGLWVINGKTWDVNRFDANPQLGDTEIWRLYNNAGGWFHPIHLHILKTPLIGKSWLSIPVKNLHVK